MSGVTKTTQKKSPSKNTIAKKQESSKKNFHTQNSPAEEILSLHQTIGNQAVQRLFSSHTIQGKLNVSQPDDKYEKEADEVADKVMRLPESQIQRQNIDKGEKEDSIQTKSIDNMITPVLQREPTGGNSVNTRDRVVNIAKQSIGRPNANGLINIFNEAGAEFAPTPLEAEEALQNDTFGSGVKVGGQKKEWCGIFATYILRKAGLAVNWTLFGGRMEGNVEFVYGTDGISKGDVAVIPKGNHHFIITSVDGNTMTTVEGNTNGQKIIQRERNIKEPYGYYRIEDGASSETSVQIKASGDTPSVNSNLESRINSLQGGGQSLSKKTRDFFEPRFGRDLSDVKVHYDSNADQLARSLNARAFTKGSDIVFKNGEYAPKSFEGKRLLGHELTHVMQQKKSSIQKKSDTATKKENIAPGIVELKNMPLFKPQPAIDKWLDEQKRSRGKVKVRYGKIAEGIVTVRKSKDQYRIKKQAITLNHPIFNKIGETSPNLTPSLLIQTGKNSTLKGFIGLSASIRNRASSLGNYLRKSPGIIGLTGFDVSKISGRNMTNKLENGQLTLGMGNVPIKFAKVLSGSFSITVNDETIQTFEGNVSVSVKGLEKGEFSIKRTPEGKVAGKGEIGVKLPKNFSGNLLVEWDGTAFSGEGKVGYQGEKLSGSVTLNVMEKSLAKQLENEKKSPQKKTPAKSKKSNTKKEGFVVFGQGDLTFAFNEWLNGTAQVIVDPIGHVTVIGEITPQKEFELFPQKDYNKKLVQAEARASYGIPVVGNIFIFANLGLYAFAKLGPAKFYKIKVAGTYSTDPKKRNNFTIQGSLNISAAAGLKLRGEAGAGLEILAHDIKAGAGINALAGIKGYAEATPVIGYREKAKEGEDKKGEFFIKGDLEIAAQPFLGLGGDLFVEVDSPFWSPLGDKKWTWPLGNKEWPIGGNFGVSAAVDYVFGSKQWPKVEFKKVDFSADKFLTDLYTDKTKAKSSDKGEKKGQWKEKNSKTAEPSGKSKKGNLEEGKAPKLPKAKSKVKPGGSKKATKPVDPNAKTAEGKSIKQLQKEAMKKDKKTEVKGVSKGKAKETTKEPKKQTHDEQLKAGLAALEAVTNRYAKDGATFEEMTTGVKSVRRKFKVFKSISVIEKNGYWYYEYMASPKKMKRAAKLKEKNDIKKVLEQVLKNYQKEGAPLRNIKLDLKEIKLKKHDIKSIKAYQSGSYWNFKYVPKGKKRPIRIPDLKIKIKGTKKNPIPITLYKSKNNYKPIELKTKFNQKQKIYEYKEYKMENIKRISYTNTKDGKRKRLTIGVANKYIQFLKGSQPILVKQRQKSRTKSNHFRVILKSFLKCKNINTMEIDHVQDLQFGGQDEYQNLWPIDTNINQKGKDVRYKAYDTYRKKSNQVWRLQKDQTTNYWIKIK